MSRSLTNAEINHLRRLLGWIRCEIGQSPEEMVNTVKTIAPSIQDCDDEGKARILEAYQKCANVPQYIRAGVKALEKVLDAIPTVEAESKDITLKRINTKYRGAIKGWVKP